MAAACRTPAGCPRLTHKLETDLLVISVFLLIVYIDRINVVRSAELMISSIPTEMLWLVAVFIMLMAGFLAAAEE
jgi:hypothetical protein